MVFYKLNLALQELFEVGNNNKPSKKILDVKDGKKMLFLVCLLS
jgi:hypothetical protein